MLIVPSIGERCFIMERIIVLSAPFNIQRRQELYVHSEHVIRETMRFVEQFEPNAIRVKDDKGRVLWSINECTKW